MAQMCTCRWRLSFREVLGTFQEVVPARVYLPNCRVSLERYTFQVALLPVMCVTKRRDSWADSHKQELQQKNTQGTHNCEHSHPPLRRFPQHSAAQRSSSTTLGAAGRTGSLLALHPASNSKEAPFR